MPAALCCFFFRPHRSEAWCFFLIQGELQEDPTDLIANLIKHSTPGVIRSRTSASAFLLVHGVTKLLLVAGLLSHKLWSYPAAIVVFGAFTVYQFYELIHRFSFFLGAVTVLDLIVIVLIVEEYRHVKAIGTR